MRFNTSEDNFGDMQPEITNKEIIVFKNIEHILEVHVQKLLTYLITINDLTDWVAMSSSRQ